MLIPIGTEPVLRRHRGSHGASHTVDRHSPSSDAASLTAQSTMSAAALPHADPCYNYFEIFPEEVGAVGNVEVTDSEEAYQWQLVGRPVSSAVAEAEGGCVKVIVEGAAAPQYYCIMDSDDVVYGRAAYLPRSTTIAAVAVSRALKEEPSVFSECCSEACSAEDENEETSPCSSPCGSITSTHCVYPVRCA
jgi:hypothetical protein